MSDREIWVGPAGDILEGVHPATQCEGRGCPFHHPSDHHMVSWRINWRNDRGLVERMCPAHGVGHPDPDHMAWFRSRHSKKESWAEGVHGCCGCCREVAA